MNNLIVTQPLSLFTYKPKKPAPSRNLLHQIPKNHSSISHPTRLVPPSNNYIISLPNQFAIRLFLVARPHARNPSSPKKRFFQGAWIRGIEMEGIMRFQVPLCIRRWKRSGMWRWRRCSVFRYWEMQRIGLVLRAWSWIPMERWFDVFGRGE